MKECKYCDLEGPHYLPGPFFTSYELLDFHRALHRLGRELMKPFERLINWIENKLTRKPKYEPAGIIHYGEHNIMLGINHYSAYNQPDGTTDVYVNDEYLGNFPFHDSLYAIIDHHRAMHRKGRHA